MLSAALSTLLDDARAEAKRAGHPFATPLHLAAALARREPVPFDAVFGAGAGEAVRRRLLKAMPSGSEQDTIALLEAAASDDPQAVILLLKEKVPGVFERPSQASAGDGRPDPPGGGVLKRVEADPSIVGFDALVTELISLLAMRRPATPLVCGSSGAGRSSVVVALATRLEAPGYAGPLAGLTTTRVDTAAVLSDDPIAALDRALDAQRPDEILAVDDLESLLSLGSAATILPMLARLRGAAANPARRLLLLLDDGYRARLEAIDQELISLATVVEVPQLPIDLLWEIARAQGTALASHHGVELPDDVVRLAASPRASIDRRAHPGLLADRLDRACARAALRPERLVREEDLGLASAPEVAPLDAGKLVEALRRRVRGQDSALEQVAARLTLTRAQLDLRPTRPDGVFLFVGPTGVGKTELARALCEALFGDEQRLVRLDMSEYAETWALSRLVGPQPGYVGYTEPEAWLTTRIREQPDTVVLLDEIEKAHETIWNAFLQVFDVGVLTDARGNVANFEHAVIAMTSNLGSEAFGSPPVGFAAPEDDAAIARGHEQRVLEAVKREMPPELINRLDEMIVFQPLTPEAIAEIATIELERARLRLAERGYVITIGDDVAELVATSGYDPALGARHLQRNVERLVLEPLATMADRELVAEVADGKVVWRSATEVPRR